MGAAHTARIYDCRTPGRAPLELDVVPARARVGRSRDRGGAPVRVRQAASGHRIQTYTSICRDYGRREISFGSPHLLDPVRHPSRNRILPALPRARAESESVGSEARGRADRDAEDAAPASFSVQYA